MSKNSQKKISNNINRGLIPTIFLVVFIVIPVAITYSSNSVNFIDKKFVYSVDNIFAQIPLLPKTTRQVLVRSSVVNKNLRNYSLVSDIKVGNKSNSLIDLIITGSIEKPGEDASQSQSKVSGKILLPTQANIDFETFTKGENFYFKINRGVVLPGFDSSHIQGWYRLNLKSMEKDLKVDIRNEKEIIGDIDKELQTYLNQVIKDGKFSKKIVNEKGRNYFEVKMKIKDDPFTKFLLPSLKNTESDLTLTIEKRSYQLKKLKLEQKVKDQLTINFDYYVSDQNKKTDLIEPVGAEEINNPVELYLLFTSGDKPTPENLLKALGGEVKEFSTTLLTIERLTKVMLLLPKSF